MKRLLPVLMGVALLLSSTEGWSLPSCPADGHASTWNDCVGIHTFAVGRKYVGEWKYGSWHGEGTLYKADGTVTVEGIWKNGRFLYAKRSPLEKAKEQCVEIGFKKGTEKFGDCVMKLLN